MDDLLCLRLRNGAAHKSSARSYSRSLAGKRVLITGAAGSVGSAISSALARMGAARIAMLDRDDSALHALRLSQEQLDGCPPCAYFLRDICDEGGLRDAFGRERPQVVIHAAALKQVPLLEENPDEAYRVNVDGTLATLRAAVDHDVEVLVNASSDKASNPTTVLGVTKRLGERLTSHFGATLGRRYVSVRFGNVLGSRGSFLPKFIEHIENGWPIDITHEDATRYLMRIDDAIELVLVAISHGRPGETLIADMGKPVRILDVARLLMDDFGVNLPVRVTGLRSGDKLREDYLDDSESPSTLPTVDGVVVVTVEPIDPESLRLSTECHFRDLERTPPT